MKKNKLCLTLSSIALCLTLLSGCGKESTKQVLDSASDKMASVTKIDQTINSDVTADSTTLSNTMNLKGDIENNRYFCESTINMGIIKLNMLFNISDNKFLIKYPDIFNKYIDLSSSDEGKELTNYISSMNLSNSSSEYNKLFKKAFEIAKNSDYKLNDVKKTINDKEQSVKELTVAVDDDEINSIIKETTLNILNESSSSNALSSQMQSIIDSMEVSNFNLSTYINKDYMPIYTELSYDVSIDKQKYTAKINMTVNSYDKDVDIPSVDDSEIATDQELKNSPLSNIGQ